MHWMNGGWVMILWWLLLLLGVFILIKWIVSQKSESTKVESAFEILKKRYVRGEITKDEYEQMKSDII